MKPEATFWPLGEWIPNYAREDHARVMHDFVRDGKYRRVKIRLFDFLWSSEWLKIMWSSFFYWVSVNSTQENHPQTYLRQKKNVLWVPLSSSTIYTMADAPYGHHWSKVLDGSSYHRLRRWMIQRKFKDNHCMINVWNGSSKALKSLEDINNAIRRWQRKEK